MQHCGRPDMDYLSTTRFTMETLDMPATGQLKSLDVDNGLALEDWRASGLGPCVATHFDRQVVGEYPHSDEVGCVLGRLRHFPFVVAPGFAAK